MNRPENFNEALRLLTLSEGASATDEANAYAVRACGHALLACASYEVVDMAAGLRVLAARQAEAAARPAKARTK